VIKKSLRNAVITGFLVGLIVGVGATAAYAATTYTSWASYLADSTTYTTRAYVTDASGGVGGLHNKRSDGASSPSGYLGGKATIWRSGALCNSSPSVVYNGSAVVQLVVQVSKTCAGGNYTASGTAYAYKPSTGTYAPKTTVQTPILVIP
jgi:hypothetical protein